jgi:hypothetical protein
MRVSTPLKLFVCFIFCFGFNTFQGYSNVVYNSSPPVEHSVKSKKRQVRKYKKIKRFQRKSKTRIHVKNNSSLKLFFTVLSISLLVLGALLFYFGINFLLLAIVGLCIIFLAFAVKLISHFNVEAEEIVGFAFFMGIAFLIGLFLLIYGLFLFFPLLWIVGIVLLVLVALIIVINFIYIFAMIGQIN